MNTLKAGINSWKTTIIGCAIAALLIVQEALKNGVQLTDIQLWVAVGIAVLGIVSRDSDKSSQDAGVRPE